MKYLFATDVFSGVLMKLRSGETHKDKINCKESTTFLSPMVLVATVHYYALYKGCFYCQLLSVLISNSRKNNALSSSGISKGHAKSHLCFDTGY